MVAPRQENNQTSQRDVLLFLHTLPEKLMQLEPQTHPEQQHTNVALQNQQSEPSSPFGHGVSPEQIKGVTNTADAACMSFSLPKTSKAILQIALACLHAQLIEHSVNGNNLNAFLTFPKSFKSGVEVLTNSIRTSIPKPDFLHLRK
jgi:hypothetical protein